MLLDISIQICHNKNAMKAVEGKDYTFQDNDTGDVKIRTVTILTDTGKDAFNLAIGEHTSIGRGDFDFDNNNQIIVTSAIEQKLCQWIKQSGAPLKKLLTVGIGNGAFLTDSTGPKVCSNLEQMKSKVKTYKPSVYGLTGIITADAVVRMTQRINQSHTVLIDSGRAPISRMLNSVYMTSAEGIAPGAANIKGNMEYVKELESIVEDYTTGWFSEKAMQSLLSQLGLKGVDDLRTYMENTRNSSKMIDSQLLQTPAISIGVFTSFYDRLNPDSSNFFIDEYDLVWPKNPALTSNAISFYTQAIATAIDNTDRQLRD